MYVKDTMSLEVIQIIEDDLTQARLLDVALRKAAFRTNVAHDGQVGVRDVQRLRPELVLLDLMLPGLDGQGVCRLLKSDPATRNIPIIMMTALGDEAHRVAGLEAGADDYLVKPVGEQELVARIKAVLRRIRPPIDEPLAESNGELRLEQDRYDAVFRGKPVTLSGKEWRLLRRLVRSAGSVVPREELATLIWGEDGLIHEHELDRLVGALSAKLTNEQARTDGILPVPGTGYRLAAASI